jgi:hypothetical protein
MAFKRKCNICDFIGIDDLYFTKNKKTCNICFDKKIDVKEQKKLESESKKREYLKSWRFKNKEYLKEYSIKWVSENPDKIKEYSKKSYLKNKKSLSLYSKKYQKNRRLNDPIFKLTSNLRNLIKNSLIKQGYDKKSKTQEIVGMSYEDFRNYIECKFTDGMSWENYGDWHLDHIVPICSAKSESEAISLCYYENFQPLWAIDNQTKGGKIL